MRIIDWSSYVGSSDLDLSVRTEEKNVTSAHFIRFSPIHNKIEHVQDDTYDPSQDRTFIADAKVLWDRHRFAKRLGLYLPSEADYDLLHDELRRGADRESVMSGKRVTVR